MNFSPRQPPPKLGYQLRRIWTGYNPPHPGEPTRHVLFKPRDKSRQSKWYLMPN